MCVHQGKRCSQHGGLITYIHLHYNFDTCSVGIDSNIWEGLVIKILSNNNISKNIFICNTYRPPKDNLTYENMNKYADELNLMLSDFNRTGSIILLLGDFNIDLLKLNDKILIKDYLDNFFSQGFYPLIITLPTRVTETSVTLIIDNVFINQSNIHSSGILVSDLSDHYPYFCSLNPDNNYVKKQENIYYTRQYNDKNFKKFYKELLNKNIFNNLSKDMNLDPNLNYNLLEDILIASFNKNIPLKKIKFHKHKHKKSDWITYGIIKSITFRDSLYKSIKQTSRDSIDFLTIKHNLSVYNKILKRLIRNAKMHFYNSKFNRSRSDSKKTWQTINEVLTKKKSKSLPDHINVDNQKITDNGQIANYFNNYFGQIGLNMASSIAAEHEINFMDYLTSNINTSFSFESVNESKVRDIIKQLNSKSSSGNDGISTNIFKKLEPLLSKSLH